MKSFYVNDAISPVIMVSWKDADGNYYYKEISLAQEFAIMKANLDYKNNGTVLTVSNNPDGKQLKFTWEDMYGAPSCLDLGVTTSGKLAVAYDMLAVYGKDQVPEEMHGMYQQYLSWSYRVLPASETCGNIQIISIDHFGDEQIYDLYYMNLDGEKCNVTSEMLYLTNAPCEIATETIPVYIEQGGIMM